MAESKLNWDKYSSDEEKKEKIEKPLQKPKKNKKPKHKEPVEEPSVYSEKEIEYIDKYLPKVKNAMDENELYDLIIKFNFDDRKIEDEINHRLKLIEVKGEEFGWTEVKKKIKKPAPPKHEKKNKKNKQKEKKKKKK